MKYLLLAIAVVVISAGAFLFFITPESFQSDSQKHMTLSITSSAFEHNASIPAKYTCDADNTNPPLSISGIPEGTVSVALIMEDPDVPKALKPDGMFDHWIVYSIPVLPQQTSVEIPQASTELVSGLNGRGEEGYRGPCPPPEYEPTEHRYFFKAYALSTELSFLAPPTKKEVETAMHGYVLASGELIGRYDRKEK